MTDLALIRRLLEYSDWANATVLDSATALSDEQLDRALEIGPGSGSLRRVLTHTWAGEDMWLRRWRGDAEPQWPNESDPVYVGALRPRFEKTRAEREVFIATLRDDALARVQTYRDSRGGLFRATLADMLLQGIVHSVHHRAQATNAIRRLGGGAPEMDYMMRVRQPA